MRACVIFVTRYGNTERVARALGLGLQEGGVETVCLNAKDVDVGSLEQYDLVCVGAPTEYLTASRPMRDFLSRLKGVDLAGKFGYAFDTKLDRPLSGSAAKVIEKELTSLGLRMVAGHESARVYLPNGRVTEAGLKGGEERRFEQIGAQVGLQIGMALQLESA